MLTLTGRVLNVFKKEGRTDTKTGEVYPATSHVQIAGEVPMENGTHKLEFFDLKTDQAERFTKAQGKRVSVPVKQWVFEGRAGVYMEKGVKVELLKEAS